MMFRDCSNNTGASAQGTAQGTLPVVFGHAHYGDAVAPRESALDAACSAAGPDYAVVADADGINGIVRYDVERGTPVEDIPAAGWVS